jgi:tRNA (guanine-N7-)-methyltransferase
MFGPESIDQAIALFPVPWPKDRHAKRRLFSTEFLTLLSSRLRAGGLARIVTDFEPLRDWILEQVPGSGLAARDRTVDARENTKYERKWLENGQSAFFEIHLAKETHIAVPAPEEPSVQVYRFESFDPARFVPQNQVGTVTIKFFDQVYDPIRKIVLVRAFISEGRLVQELWIKIEPEGVGWRLGPAGKLNVVPTQGVMRALEIAFEACR